MIEMVVERDPLLLDETEAEVQEGTVEVVETVGGQFLIVWNRDG